MNFLKISRFLSKGEFFPNNLGFFQYSALILNLDFLNVTGFYFEILKFQYFFQNCSFEYYFLIY